MTFQELRAAAARAAIAEDDRDRAYRERAQLLAHFAALYPSRLAYSDWDNPEWPVLTVETPAGQMSWHINPSDADLFRHVHGDNQLVRDWDGHTTAEKYERLRHLTNITILTTLTPESDQP